MSTHAHGQLGVLKYPDPHVFGLHVEARDTGSACTAGACVRACLIKCHINIIMNRLQVAPFLAKGENSGPLLFRGAVR